MTVTHCTTLTVLGKSLTYLPGDKWWIQKTAVSLPTPHTPSVIICCISLPRSSFILNRNKNTEQNSLKEVLNTAPPQYPNYKGAYTPDILLNFGLMALTTVLVIFRPCWTFKVVHHKGKSDCWMFKPSDQCVPVKNTMGWNANVFV